MKLFSSFDLFIITIIFAVFFLFFGNENYKKNDRFEIYYDGKVIEIPLAKDTTIIINSVEIKFENQSVKIVKSDCPNQICVATGLINSSGQIVCAPNKVIVSLHKKKTEIDVYAH